MHTYYILYIVDIITYSMHRTLISVHYYICHYLIRKSQLIFSGVKRNRTRIFLYTHRLPSFYFFFYKNLNILKLASFQNLSMCACIYLHKSIDKYVPWNMCDSQKTTWVLLLAFYFVRDKVSYWLLHLSG